MRWCWCHGLYECVIVAVVRVGCDGVVISNIAGCVDVGITYMCGDVGGGGCGVDDVGVVSVLMLTLTLVLMLRLDVLLVVLC